jgi:hypothetical protein
MLTALLACLAPAFAPSLDGPVEDEDAVTIGAACLDCHEDIVRA